MRYLSKSRYKLALECPRKLFYTSNREYANNKSQDSFLMALADGGFQVGELAKLHFPEGIAIDDLDSAIALKKTHALVAGSQDVTIFEAAIAFEDFLVRVDVFRKIGNRIELIEVKAKSWSAGTIMVKKKRRFT